MPISVLRYGRHQRATRLRRIGRPPGVLVRGLQLQGPDIGSRRYAHPFPGAPEPPGDGPEDALDPPPQLGEQPDQEQQEQDQERQKQHRIIDRHQQAGHDAEILQDRGRPVGKGLGRGVDEHPGPSLGGVGGRGHTAAQERHRELGAEAHIPHRTGRQHGPGRDAHKGMQGIPDRIHAGDLIGEELHQIHKPGGEHDQRIGQYLQALRELHPAGGPEQA